MKSTSILPQGFAREKRVAVGLVIIAVLCACAIPYFSKNPNAASKEGSQARWRAIGKN